MSWRDLPRGLLMALLFSLSWPAVALVAGPVVGVTNALLLHLVGALLLHLFAVGDGPRQGFVAAGVGLLLVVPAAIVLPRASQVLLALAVILSVVRVLVFTNRRPARALFLELLLSGGGLWLAVTLSGSGLIGQAFGIWTFFLVQAFAFSLGSPQETVARASGGDGYERARGELTRLLEMS
ncbi:MAG: hypothetical protein AAF533_01390 [Acidobacteriota bacterium]